MSENVESETVYSAREVAEALGVGAAMLRRYSAAYERLTDTQIEIHRRDGRLFSQKQLDSLLAARALVQRQDMPVDVALETVLREGETVLAVRGGHRGDVDTVMMAEALRTALDPLLSELQGIRAELAELKQGRELPAVDNPAQKTENPRKDDTQHGILARTAIWIERKIRGS